MVGDRSDDKAVSSGRPVQSARAEASDNIEGALRVKKRQFEAEVSIFHLWMRDTIVSRTLILPGGAVGTTLGGYMIIKQLPTGAVYVAEAANPVLVRANSGRARMTGVEQSLQVKAKWGLLFSENFTWTRAADADTGLAPDIEPRGACADGPRGYPVGSGVEACMGGSLWGGGEPAGPAIVSGAGGSQNRRDEVEVEHRVVLPERCARARFGGERKAGGDGRDAGGGSEPGSGLA
ncbi:MAG: TonB-dependent receptor [Desulfobacterales bacterium]|nr:TonB-dependent receptor [Desulfobacterales bacterium]